MVEKNIFFNHHEGASGDIVIDMAGDGECEVNIDFLLDNSFAEYCFPAREFVLSDANCNFSCAHGYFFPLSYLSVLFDKFGYTFLSDTDFLKVSIVKSEEKLRISFVYGSSIKRALIKCIKHSSCWKDGLAAYKKWFEQRAEYLFTKNPLQGKYHIKRYFFHKELCPKTIFEEGKCSFYQQYIQDSHLAGGIDAALLFDYAYDPSANIRCGNLNPLCGVIDIKSLNEDIQKIKNENGCKIFIYYDPYLVQNGSYMDLKYGNDLKILDKDGNPKYIWDETQWHPCISQPCWIDESVRYLKKAFESIAADGIYFDEMGKGVTFKCCSKRHKHADYNQNDAEKYFVESVMKHFDDALNICEFPPSDRLAGCFCGVLNDTRAVFDIYRFCNHRTKYFRIINCDLPIGDNYYEVNKAFFNGEGLWLDNDLDNKEWYSQRVIDVIKEQYKVMKEYSKYFDSEDIEPLISSSNKFVLINRFTYENGSVYTAINTCKQTQKALMNIGTGNLKILYRTKTDTAEQKGDEVEMTISPHEVMCLFIEKQSD